MSTTAATIAVTDAMVKRAVALLALPDGDNLDPTEAALARRLLARHGATDLLPILGLDSTTDGTA